MWFFFYLILYCFVLSYFLSRCFSKHKFYITDLTNFVRGRKTLTRWCLISYHICCILLLFYFSWIIFKNINLVIISTRFHILKVPLGTKLCSEQRENTFSNYKHKRKYPPQMTINFKGDTCFPSLLVQMKSAFYSTVQPLLYY